MSNEIKITESHRQTTNLDTQLSKARKSTKNNKNKSIIKKKQCSNNCRKHNFELQPLGYSTFMTKGILDPIKVNFCSKGNSTTIPLPIVSHELKTQPHIPLFILNEDVRKYQYYLQQHQKQFSDAIKKGQLIDNDQEQQILVAIPKTKNCQVCRVKIDTDQKYNAHINSIQHKQRVKDSLGQKLICQAAQMFEKRRLQQSQKQKKHNQLKKVAELMKEFKKTLKGLLVSQ